MSEQASTRAVTLVDKRYTGQWVFKCIACGLLNLSVRSDKVTCCGACRVWAHRNGRLAALRRRARLSTCDDRTGRPTPALLQQADAILELRPDLLPAIDAGALTIAQAQPEVIREFWRRVFVA